MFVFHWNKSKNYSNFYSDSGNIQNFATTRQKQSVISINSISFLFTYTYTLIHIFLQESNSIPTWVSLPRFENGITHPQEVTNTRQMPHHHIATNSTQRHHIQNIKPRPTITTNTVTNTDQHQIKTTRQIRIRLNLFPPSKPNFILHLILKSYWSDQEEEVSDHCFEWKADEMRVGSSHSSGPGSKLKDEGERELRPPVFNLLCFIHNVSIQNSERKIDPWRTKL